MEKTPEDLLFEIMADVGEFGDDAAAITNFDEVMFDIPQPGTSGCDAQPAAAEPSGDSISSLHGNDHQPPTEEEGGGLQVDLGTVISGIVKLFSVVNPSHSDLIDTHEMTDASQRSAAAAAGKTPLPSKTDTIASQMLTEGLEKLSQDASLLRTVFDNLVALVEKTCGVPQPSPPPSSAPPMDTLRIFTEITTENKTCVQRLSQGMCSPAGKDFLGYVYDLVRKSRDAFVRVITLWKLFGSSVDLESLLSSDERRLANNAVLSRSNARVVNTLRNINAVLDNRNRDDDNTLFTETLRYVILPVLDTFEAKIEWSSASPSEARRTFDDAADNTGFVKIDSATRDMVLDDIRSLRRKQESQVRRRRRSIFNSFMSVADGNDSPDDVIVFADSPTVRVAKTVQLSDPLTVLRYLFQILDENNVSVQRLCTVLHSPEGDNIFWKLLYDMICKTYSILKLVTLTWKVVGSVVNLDFFLSGRGNINLSADDPKVISSVKDISRVLDATGITSASLVQFAQRLIVPVLYAISDKV